MVKKKMTMTKLSYLAVLMILMSTMSVSVFAVDNDNNNLTNNASNSSYSNTSLTSNIVYVSEDSLNTSNGGYRERNVENKLVSKIENAGMEEPYIVKLADTVYETNANTQPTLMSGAVNGEKSSWGTDSTNFVFSVVYLDQDNDAPKYVKVNINGVAYNMAKQNSMDSNYADGCTYVYSTTLASGTYQYSFATSDGYYQVSIDPVYSCPNRDDFVYTAVVIAMRDYLTKPAGSSIFTKEDVKYMIDYYIYGDCSNCSMFECINELIYRAYSKQHNTDRGVQLTEPQCVEVSVIPITFTCGKITNWKTDCTNVQLGGAFGAEMDFDNLMAGGYRFKGIVRVRSPTDEEYPGENQPRFVPSSHNNHGKFAGGNTLYVNIPEGAAMGKYDVKLELWNADTNTLCDETGWKENIFTVEDGGAVSEIVFIGTALEYKESPAGPTRTWTVSVDELISGPQPCSNQLSVIHGPTGSNPSGYMDPNIKKGDKVKVYAGYYEEQGGCIVTLGGSYSYYIKKSSSSASIKITSVSPPPGTTLNAGDTVTFTVNVDYDLGPNDYGKIRLSVNRYTTGTTDEEHSIGIFDPHSGSYTFTPHIETIGDDWENVYVSVTLYAAKQGEPLPAEYTDFDYKQYPVGGKGEGSILHFDLDYKGTEPASGEGDGNDQHQIYTQAGQSFVMYMFYKEGNAGNQYIIRAYPEWDQNSFILNSDNDESTSELAHEMGGHRYDVGNYIIPSVPGEYKIKVVYSNSANPPTWANYNRLLGEFTVIVEGDGDCFETVPSDHWKGEYYNNKNLEGSPSMVRDDGTGYLNFDWDEGSPSTACGIGSDFFSVRWTRSLNFDSGTWRFTVTTDDGMRLYVDGSLVIDKWFNQVATIYIADVDLTAGTHTIKVEYYEYDLTAVAKLSWEKGGGKEIKFTGTATDYWVSGGQIHHWTVLVDEVISGPQPCEDQVDITVYDSEVPSPWWGYVDPNLNIGDRVEVYGRYYDGHCSAMHLHGSTDYYIKEIEPLDLTISSSDISFSDENPTWGDKITISAIIHNTGNMDAKDVSIKFYYSLAEYSPDNQGYLFHEINTDILGNQEKEIGAPWVVNYGCGDFKPSVHVTVDLPSEIKETEDFANNYASKKISPNCREEPHLKGVTRIIVIPVYVSGKDKPEHEALQKQYGDVDKAIEMLRYFAEHYGVRDVTFKEFAVVDETSSTFTTDESKTKISSISEKPNPWSYQWVDEAARSIGFASAAEIWYLATQEYEDEKIVLEFALNEERFWSFDIYGMSYGGTRVFATFKGVDYNYLGICFAVDLHEFLHEFGADDEGLGGGYWPRVDHLNSIMNQNTLLLQCTLLSPHLFENTAKEIGWISEATDNELIIIAHSPVDLEIIDPEGLIIKKDSEELWGLCYYVEYDIDGDGSEEDIIEFYNRKIGNYQITVIPELDAEPTDTYTLEVTAGDTTTVLAENVAISEIPTEPYIFKSEKIATYDHDGDGIVEDDIDDLTMATDAYLGFNTGSEYDHDGDDIVEDDLDDLTMATDAYLGFITSEGEER